MVLRRRIGRGTRRQEQLHHLGATVVDERCVHQRGQAQLVGYIHVGAKRDQSLATSMRFVSTADVIGGSPHR